MWSNARPPRFRRDPVLRDGVFDHGRASVSRIAASHMLPSTLLTGSASASCWLSRLNRPPHRIVVYASPGLSPTLTQHSLLGARYGLPGPDFDRSDRTSLPGAQIIQERIRRRVDCFACGSQGRSRSSQALHHPVASASARLTGRRKTRVMEGSARSRAVMRSRAASSI